MENLTPEQVSQYKKEGATILYITCKNNIFLYYIIVITLGFKGVGKTSLIET